MSIYTLSLHDALPISGHRPAELGEPGPSALALRRRRRIRPRPRPVHSPLRTYATTGVFHRAPRADLGTERGLGTVGSTSAKTASHGQRTGFAGSDRRPGTGETVAGRRRGL